MPSLHEAMIQQGNRLFRLRSWVPALLFPAVLWEAFHFTEPFGSEQWDVGVEIGCLSVALLGLAVRCLAVGYAPSGTSGRSTSRMRASRLNTEGMYSVCRNPVYLGNFVIWLGVLSFFRSPYLLALYTVSFWFYYERVVMAEEAFLLEIHGEEYRDWRSRTPVFLPDPALWRRPSRPFSWRTVLRREYTTLFGILLVLLAFETGTDLLQAPRFHLDKGWRYALVLGGSFYLGVWILKRWTGVLRGEEKVRGSGSPASA